MEITDILFFISVIFIFSLITTNYIDCRFIYILKKKHNELWQKLERPQYIFRNLEQHKALKNFLKKEEYKPLGDVSFTKISKLLELTNTFQTSILIVFAVFFTIAVLT